MPRTKKPEFAYTITISLTPKEHALLEKVAAMSGEHLLIWASKAILNAAEDTLSRHGSQDQSDHRLINSTRKQLGTACPRHRRMGYQSCSCLRKS